MYVRINNGDYVDDGMITGYFNPITSQKWEITRNHSQLTIYPKNSTKANFTFIESTLF